jgi:hypothetical protein
MPEVKFTATDLRIADVRRALYAEADAALGRTVERPPCPEEYSALVASEEAYRDEVEAQIYLNSPWLE